ncbi:hypothetical protein NBRC116601_10650 [Cognatishimia sp. WU-CL00825]|uniref:hypothetical protein n=1 Tax=Cognatishimia sp. WU-CL00825 TaxID=3127658 RepID=UPI00310456DF
MGEIAELENRLSSALDRIANGIDKVGQAAPVQTNDQAKDQSAEIAALRNALEDERLANAQLQERLKAVTAEAQAQSVAAEGTGGGAELEMLKAGFAEEISALRQSALEEREAWEGLSGRLVRMRRSNKLMRTNALALRRAAAENVADASLINQSLQVEFDALTAAHELERAETDVILKTLQPLLGDAPEDHDFEGEA